MVVGIDPRPVADRYLLAVTPFAVYFAVQALANAPAAARGPAMDGRGCARRAHGAAPARTSATGVDARAAVARPWHDMADGPASPYVQRGLGRRSDRYTHQDDIVAFFKVRAMALYTDRRGVQSCAATSSSSAPTTS